MASFQSVCPSSLCKLRTSSCVGVLAFPLLPCKLSIIQGISASVKLYGDVNLSSRRRGFYSKMLKRLRYTLPRSTGSLNSNGSVEDSPDQTKKPFGYTRKDVILIGVGVTLAGIGLKSGLEYAGVDPFQAGNAVQLIMVLGLTLGWISTYMFRVSNKEMTYAQQLRDYEKQVMEKRLESLSEAELEALLEQVEEEKRSMTSGEQIN